MTNKPSAPPAKAPEALELLCELIFLLRHRAGWAAIVASQPDLVRIVNRAESLVQDAMRAQGEQP